MRHEQFVDVAEADPAVGAAVAVGMGVAGNLPGLDMDRAAGLVLWLRSIQKASVQGVATTRGWACAQGRAGSSGSSK